MSTPPKTPATVATAAALMLPVGTLVSESRSVAVVLTRRRNGAFLLYRDGADLDQCSESDVLVPWSRLSELSSPRPSQVAWAAEALARHRAQVRRHAAEKRFNNKHGIGRSYYD